MRDMRRFDWILTWVSALLLLAVPLATAGAQETEGEQETQATAGEDREEILVTARRREETIQDVPFSLDAKSEQDIEELGIRNIEDLSNNVAGFTVQNLGPGQSQVAIRGISAGQIVRDQPGVKEQVGIYLDDSVVSLSLFTPDLDLFDINRAEVLRGPQGTLFGSGSLSGTVRYITNQPEMNSASSKIEVEGNFFDVGGLGGSLKSMVNLPLIEDRAALRFVAYGTHYGGFIDAVQPNGLNDHANEGGRFGFRAALALQPTDRLTITPRIVYQKVRADGFNRVDRFNILANPFTTTRAPVSLGEREQFTQFDEKFTDEFLLFDAVVEYDFGPMLLTSVSSYTDRDVLQVRDATQLTASITAQPGVLTPTGLPESVYGIDAPLDDATSAEVFTQELRVASTYEDSPLQWLAGMFFSSIDRRYGQSLDVAGFEDAAAAEGTMIPTEGILAGKDILFFSDIPYEFDQFALFGEATLAVTDALDLTFGLRWYDFEETRTLNFDGIFAAQTIGERGRTTSDGLSPRVMLSYDVTEDIHLNAQASKGFRLGGINDPLNAPLCSPEDLQTFGGRDSFKDEEVWNYEAGAKTTFFDGRASLNAAVFYSDIENLQATLDAGSCSSRIIFNVPSARSVGFELEATAQPLDGLQIGVATSFVDAELRSTVYSTVGGVTTVVGGIEKGNQLPTTPKFQIAATASYEYEFRNELIGFVSGSFHHVGSRYTQIGDQAPGFGTVDITVTPIGDPAAGSTFNFDPKLPSYQTGNLRFGVRSDWWEVAFFVNNIWDERAQLALDRERGGRARVGFLTNPPRTFGLVTRASFDIPGLK